MLILSAMKNRKIRFLFSFLFAVCCVGLMFIIYTLSSEDGYASGQRSANVQEIIKENVHEYMDSTEIGQKLHYGLQSLIEAISPDGNNWYQTIRDIAHFSLYFFLALLLYITFSIAGISRLWKSILSLLICLGYALFDEFHQSMVIGRISTMDDVIVDMCGTLMSLGLCWGISAFCASLRSKPRQRL